MTTQQEERLIALFRGAYECDEKIESLNEQKKDYTRSKNEYMKNVAKELDISVKSVKEAYKQWIWSYTEPHISEDVNSIMACLEKAKLKG